MLAAGALVIGSTGATSRSADVSTIRLAPNMRYHLIGVEPEATPPAEGYRLLVVLPGGTGDDSFLPFVKDVHSKALPDGYLVAQLVAPVWSAEQAKTLVWPTMARPSNDMQFPTEIFVDRVIDDVMARHPIDTTHVYALGWSSGGPPVYTCALARRTKITGAMIAMSVFKPRQLPALDGAEDRPFYLLHSPDDWIPMSNAERAEITLRDAGARTKLTSYPGGHGWPPNRFDLIRDGIRWLETPSPPDPAHTDR